jgi:hypothetical protein
MGGCRARAAGGYHGCVGPLPHKGHAQTQEKYIEQRGNTFIIVRKAERAEWCTQTQERAHLVLTHKAELLLLLARAMQVAEWSFSEDVCAMMLSLLPGHMLSRVHKYLVGDRVFDSTHSAHTTHVRR